MEVRTYANMTNWGELQVLCYYDLNGYIFTSLYFSRFFSSFDELVSVHDPQAKLFLYSHLQFV